MQCFHQDTVGPLINSICYPLRHIHCLACKCSKTYMTNRTKGDANIVLES